MAMQPLNIPKPTRVESFIAFLNFGSLITISFAPENTLLHDKYRNAPTKRNNGDGLNDVFSQHFYRPHAHSGQNHLRAHLISKPNRMPPKMATVTIA